MQYSNNNQDDVCSKRVHIIAAAGATLNVWKFRRCWCDEDLTYVVVFAKKGFVAVVTSGRSRVCR